MAGYWPSQYQRGQYPAILTEQAWSIKDLLYGKKTPKHDLCTCGTKPVSRTGKMACRSGSQSQREIRFILPAHGAKHIIKQVITLYMYLLHHTGILALKNVIG